LEHVNPSPCNTSIEISNVPSTRATADETSDAEDIEHDVVENVSCTATVDGETASTVPGNVPGASSLKGEAGEYVSGALKAEVVGVERISGGSDDDVEIVGGTATCPTRTGSSSAVARLSEAVAGGGESGAEGDWGVTW